MNFFSYIQFQKSSVDISYDDSMILFGSCFAETIGHKLIESKFRADINPFGILFNPESILLSIKRLICNEKYDKKDLFFHEGLYHSFYHHSHFSDVSEDSCLQKINKRLHFSVVNMQRANKIFITFGTAYVYRLKETGQVVANCHKLSDTLFHRERLSVSQIVDSWDELLALLFETNKELKLFFTVSPIRHWKDGAHDNQLSKSTLLLAVEQLQMRYPNQLVYFPAYELMMDELRDYRFYADDLFHPSAMAIQYIWERFMDVFMNNETQTLLNEIGKIQKALNHRPLNLRSKSNRQFQMQTLSKVEQLEMKMPYLCFEKEKEKLKLFLQQDDIQSNDNL